MKTMSRAAVVPLFCAVLSIFLLGLAGHASAQDENAVGPPAVENAGPPAEENPGPPPEVNPGPTAEPTATAGPPAGLGMARVTYIEGDTSFNSEDTDEWAALSPNFALRDGDRLWAGDNSKVEVQFTGGHMAWVNYQTEMDLVKMQRNEDTRAFQVAVASGEATFYTKKMGPKGVFQVDTPNASIRAYDRAHFRVTTLPDGSTQVGVSAGSVELETQAGLSNLGKGEMAEITKDGQVIPGALPEKDEWDQWVDSRWDRYKTPPRSARYLPPDLADYGYEFDEGGRWAQTPDNGWVWSPRVDPAWSPYSNGRWVWVAGDYVWLPYDAWYAPFHYGRWGWSLPIGWYWVPPVTVGVRAFWSPGYVGWSWGAGVVSWVPLAPREIYYGFGYYGPESVNVNVTKVTVVKNVYVNSMVKTGVVVVNRDSFLKGDIKRVAISQSQNPFRHPGVMGARPVPMPPGREIKPTMDTKIPRPGVKPKAVPPRQLDKVFSAVRERPVVRTPGKSAFRPNAAPPKLPLRELGKVPSGKPGAITPSAPGFGRRPAPGERALRPAPPGRPGVQAPKGAKKKRPKPPEERR